MSGSLRRDLLCWGAPRSFGRSVAYLGLVLIAAFGLNHRAFFADGPAFNDGHAIASLELAIVRAYCAQPSSFSNSIRVPYDVRDQIALRYVPLRTLIIRKAGPIEAFCRTANQPFVNNENSLMLLESIVLRLWPGVSLVEIGQTLQLIRIGGVALFVLLLLQAGGSLALGLATIMGSLMLMDRMIADVYSAYPFLFVLLLVLAAFYGLALTYRWTRGRTGLVLSAGLAGLLSAFIANLRTSYFPIVVLCFACFLVSELRNIRQARNAKAHLTRAAVLVAVFAAAYGAFQYGVILRGIPVAGRHGAAHSIGHPLVLSISVPENDFSRQMGITWLDEVGRQKALSVDPEAAYLGPRYDGALLRYYRTLWTMHPREMLAVYYLKFSVAGTHMLSILRGNAGPLGLLLAPLSFAPSGIWLLALYGVIAAGSFGLFVRDGAAPIFVMGLLSVMACLAQIESGVIYSLFYYQYHNYLAFFAIFLSLLGAQALVNTAAILMRRGAGSSHVTRPLAWLAREMAVPQTSASLATAAVRVACAFCVVWVVVPQWFSIERTVTSDRQALDVMDAAINSAVCGAAAPASRSVPVAEPAATRGDLQVTPIRSVVLAQAGTIEAYCLPGADDPPRGHSPLLMLETSILRLRPNMSAAGLAKALHYLRIAGVLGFVLMLMNVGYGVAFGCAVTLSGLWLLVIMKEHLYSAPPFNLVLILLSVVLYGCAIQWRWLATPGGYVTAGAASGAWSALVVGMDPGYLVLQAGLLVEFILADRLVDRGAEGWRMIGRPLMLVGGAATAYVAVQSVVETAVQSGLGPGNAVDLQSLSLLPLPAVSTFLGSAWMFGSSLLVVAVALVWFVRTRSTAALVPALLGTAACLLPGRFVAGSIRSYGDESYLAFFAMFIVLLCCQSAAALVWGAAAPAVSSRPA